MKNRLSIIAAAAIAFCFVVASHPAAAADDQAAQTKQVTTKQVTTKKVVTHKRHHVAKVVRQEAPYSRLEPYRSSGFVGDYPGDCARQRAGGECVVDLGYGRCVSCSIGGGGRR